MRSSEMASGVSSSIDVTIILTAHREGLLAGPTAHSARAAIAAAGSTLRCETIVVLDRADGLTGSVLKEAFKTEARFIETNEGDPGQARNRGIECAKGAFACFLDGDDLWSENWILAAYSQARSRPDAVYHPACLIRFGSEKHLFWHPDSESKLCDCRYLEWLNYWDALSFASREIFLKHPFKRNDIESGFGHEDWHWNAWTVAEGIAHKVVPETIHFKRARPGSQMSKVDRVGGVRWPLHIE